MGVIAYTATFVETQVRGVCAWECVCVKVLCVAAIYIPGPSVYRWPGWAGLGSVPSFPHLTSDGIPLVCHMSWRRSLCQELKVGHARV